MLPGNTVYLIVQVSNDLKDLIFSLSLTLDLLRLILLVLSSMQFKIHFLELTTQIPDVFHHAFKILFI